MNKLLLLSCCAPCSCGVIAHLAKQSVDFCVLFYNPNITPVAEYRKRADENKRVCEKYGVPFVELEYDNERWCELTKGLETEPERSKRCDICFQMRLKRAFEYAQENGFHSVTSVLGVSRYKDFDQVNRAVIAAGGEGIYDTTNWRKNGLESLRQALSKELNLYAQNYCGCKPK